MQNWKTTRFLKGIKLTQEDYDWIKEYKGKKSAAGFLENILKYIKSSKQYKNGKNKT